MPFMTVERAVSGATPPSPSIHPLAAHEAVTLWNPATDAARVCQELGASPPWYRFEDSRRSWQFAVLMLVPLATLASFLFGLRARSSARRERSIKRAKTTERAFQLTLVGGIVSALLFVILWEIV
jgi:hypothetical protein